MSLFRHANQGVYSWNISNPCTRICSWGQYDSVQKCVHKNYYAKIVVYPDFFLILKKIGQNIF